MGQEVGSFPLVGVCAGVHPIRSTPVREVDREKLGGHVESAQLVDTGRRGPDVRRLLQEER